MLAITQVQYNRVMALAMLSAQKQFIYANTQYVKKL